jgi:hypothetical protein
VRTEFCQTRQTPVSNLGHIGGRGLANGVNFSALACGSVSGLKAAGANVPESERNTPGPLCLPLVTG